MYLSRRETISDELSEEIAQTVRHYISRKIKSGQKIKHLAADLGINHVAAGKISKGEKARLSFKTAHTLLGGHLEFKDSIHKKLHDESEAAMRRIELEPRHESQKLEVENIRIAQRNKSNIKCECNYCHATYKRGSSPKRGYCSVECYVKRHRKEGLGNGLDTTHRLAM